MQLPIQFFEYNSSVWINSIHFTVTWEKNPPSKKLAAGAARIWIFYRSPPPWKPPNFPEGGGICKEILWWWVTIWTFWNKMFLLFCLLEYELKNKIYFELKVYNSLGFHFLLNKTILLNQLSYFREEHVRPWWSTSVKLLQQNHLQHESYSSEV